MEERGLYGKRMKMSIERERETEEREERRERRGSGR